MIMTKTITVSGVANQEVTKTILTSTESNKWRINRIWVTEVTATLQNDAILRFYRDLYLLTDFAYNNFLTSYTSGVSNIPRVLQLDVDLPVGSEFHVGHVSGGTASDIQYTIEYESSTGA